MKLVLYGMIIGIANIIPGVSGGTMAVILNVYDKIISSVSNFKSKFKDSVKFLAPIGLGALIGIVLFSKIIEYTLANYNVSTNMVFVGLIIGSVPMIFKSATKEKANFSHYLSFLVCLGIMLFMKFANPDDSAVEIITSLDLVSSIKLFLISIVSAGAMIIPGISGSFVMLLLGAYTTVLTAISDFNIIVLIPVGLGCLVGIVGCAKVIEKLFAKFESQTYFGILGFMIGSIFIILPNFSLNSEFVISVILLALSAFTAYIFSKK